MLIKFIEKYSLIYREILHKSRINNKLNDFYWKRSINQLIKDNHGSHHIVANIDILNWANAYHFFPPSYEVTSYMIIRFLGARKWQLIE